MNPCRSCSTALQHCLEMRNGPSLSECGTYCCAPCAENPDLNATPPETEQERRARHLTPGVHRNLSVPTPELQYGLRDQEGTVWEMPSLQQARSLGRHRALQVVFRTVNPWEVL